MLEAGERQTGELLQAVRIDRRARRHVLLDEGRQCRRPEVGNHGHAHATRFGATFLDGDQHQRGVAALQLAAPAQPGLRTADPRVIDLHLAVQRLAGRSDPRAPQLVQQHPRRFVSTKAELPLEQESRHATRVGHRQVGRPEPHRQRRFRVVENRARGQRDLVPTRRALPPPVLLHAIRALVPAPWTGEPIGPATRGQVVLTGRFAGALTLKVAHILRKRRPRHAATLHMVAAETTG
jgi:hypothetical protein